MRVGGGGVSVGGADKVGATVLVAQPASKSKNTTKVKRKFFMKRSPVNGGNITARLLGFNPQSMFWIDFAGNRDRTPLPSTTLPFYPSNMAMIAFRISPSFSGFNVPSIETIKPSFAVNNFAGRA